MQYSQKLFDDNKKLIYAWFSSMFTRVDVLIYADASRTDLISIAERIETEIERIESFANRFDENSEISRLNRNAFIEEFVMSEELFDILTECQLYSGQVGGLFDITVNSHNDFRGGIEAISLNRENHSIRFLHPDLQLDLSGFIKGYSLRVVRELLKKEHIDNALINAGNSSILALGNHPNGKGWKIRHPDMNTKNDCVLFNECLTTSGNSEQTKWPVVNPHSGKTIVKKQSVSVITPDPAIGEILSTALYIAGNNEKEMILNQFQAREMVW